MLPVKEDERPRYLLNIRGWPLNVARVAVLIFAIWAVYYQYQISLPHISSIPLLSPGQSEIVIIGQNFSPRQATVWLSAVGNQPRRELEVLSWQDDRITARLPAGVTFGSLEIQRPSIFGTHTSDPVSFITSPYPQNNPSSLPPVGITPDTAVSYQASDSSKDGTVTVQFKLDAGASYPLKDHQAAILLFDAVKMEVVSMEYASLLSAQADQAGNLKSASLRVPAGTSLPANLEVYVILDGFPLAGYPLGK
jgi:hypothetical protein